MKRRAEISEILVAPKGDGLNEDVPPKSDDVVVPNFLFDR